MANATGFAAPVAARGPGRAGTSDGPRDLAVHRGPAFPHVREHQPDPTREGRARDVEREIEAPRPPLDERNDRTEVDRVFRQVGRGKRVDVAVTRTR